ncbi:hypothetical protein [Streptomyces sp. NPDC016845]|uniref:hypothetical protein n=1 Tax=Streptomyces sp. NPDC016845 TaxID=3364972 RepID=UPI00378D5330
MEADRCTRTSAIALFDRSGDRLSGAAGHRVLVVIVVLRSPLNRGTQAPVKRYDRTLRDLIAGGKAKPPPAQSCPWQR